MTPYETKTFPFNISVEKCSPRFKRFILICFIVARVLGHFSSFIYLTIVGGSHITRRERETIRRGKQQMQSQALVTTVKRKKRPNNKGKTTENGTNRSSKRRLEQRVPKEAKITKRR
ncbi:hypothetical protein BDC45DRAFT_533794 [Circinella umbellata]|nr:hypothetical protein BDC45DRAFT_533794 [Circinella umbellata]